MSVKAALAVRGVCAVGGVGIAAVDGAHRADQSKKPQVRSSCITLLIASATHVACVDCPRAVGLDAAQCQALPGLQLPQHLPASIGNAKADDPAAALLGFSLFFDARLSRGEQVRCASCHVPERAFADGLPTSVGVAQADRNSPSIYTAAWHRWQMWDGRADSLWSQAVLPFENRKEMDFTRLELAHRIFTTWRAPYEAVFGPLPALDDAARYPARGKPGEPAFEAMAPSAQLEVNRVAANVGKALEAYQRRAAHGPGAFDRFVAGDAAALTALEREGLVVFHQARCDACHGGPTLADDGFHVLGVPPAEGQLPERGRVAALELLASSPFTVSGPFHDGPAVEGAPPVAGEEGAYRTPSLRNVARTGPWGHNGTFPTLERIVDFHLQGGAGDVDRLLVKVTLAAREREALLAFLRSLDVADPPSPWNNWPDR
jgi:cytochrome c peroxidase